MVTCGRGNEGGGWRHVATGREETIGSGADCRNVPTVRRTLTVATRILLIAAAVLAAGAAPPPRAAEDNSAAIRRVLEEQAAAWNRGDVEGFLAGYWKSDATAFAGTQGILHGWQALLERYRRSYPDRRAMGTLAFSRLEVTLLCDDAALVLGHWHLEREAGLTGGVFSLVLRRFPEGWRIIADHTSVVPAAPGAPGE